MEELCGCVEEPPDCVSSEEGWLCYIWMVSEKKARVSWKKDLKRADADIATAVPKV